MDGKPGMVAYGIIAVGNAHKDKVKLTFSRGRASPNPLQALRRGP